MCKRSVRFRMDELRAKKVSQLREVASTLQVNLSGCIEKSEVIERLLTSGRIQIIDGAPAIVKSKAEFESLSVAELKIMLLSFGLSRNGALEKSELQSRLLSSGRVEIEGYGENINDSADRKDLSNHYSLEARNDDSKVFFSQIISNKYFNDSDYSTLNNSTALKTALSRDDTKENLLQKAEEGSVAFDRLEKVNAVIDTSYSYSTSPTSTKRTDISRFITNRSSENIKGVCYINGNSSAAGNCRPSNCSSHCSLYTSSLSAGKEKDIRSMSIAELQQLSADLSVSTANCLYKSDMIDGLIASGRIPLSGGSKEEQV